MQPASLQMRALLAIMLLFAALAAHVMHVGEPDEEDRKRVYLLISYYRESHLSAYNMELKAY